MFKKLLNVFNFKKNEIENKNIVKIEEKEDYVYIENPLICTQYKNIKLKNHQIKICHQVKDKNIDGLLLFHSVGSGKTITAITLIRCILQEYPDKKIYILSPKSLLSNFEKEMKKLNIKFDKNVEFFSHVKFINKIKNDGIDFCINSVIVIDEAHNFKTIISKSKKGDENGKRSKLLMNATSVADKIFLLTATPIFNNPKEFINLYAMISKNEKNLKEIKHYFEYPYQDLDLILKNKISYFKNNDIINYPSVEYNDIKLEMTPEYYNLYMDIENGITDYSKIYSGNVHKYMNGIRRAVNLVDEKIETPKLSWSINLIKENIKKNKKTLIYSNWKESGINLIENKLNELNIKNIKITGDIKIEDRNDAVKKYNNGNIKVLFITAAGSEGLDLKETSDVIIFEPHWNNERINQVIGRAVRYKSHENLPEKERVVKIHSLILIKPYFKSLFNLNLSADEILHKLAYYKNLDINEFYKILIKSSI